MSKPKLDETSYLWQNIPKDLWYKARSKALSENMAMKDVLKMLIIRWLSE